MNLKAYVLIKVRVGQVEPVIKQLRTLEGVLEADITFGPFDIIAIVEANNVNHLGKLIYFTIQPIPGIQETLSCLIADQ